MTRSVQEPEESVGHMERGKVYKHPAFGLIHAGRTTGGASVLFGSDFEHHNSVRITISGAELHRSLSNDWHHGRNELIEVELSEAQWATFVSSLNMGGGTPCTVRHIGGKRTPEIPLRRVEDVAKAEAAAKFQQVSSRVKATIAAMEGEIGKSLSKVKRDKLLEELHSLDMDLRSSLPFMQREFGEHMEGVVEKAKIEVNAYMQTTISRAGLKALTDQAPLALNPGKKEGGS
jgi:hypothetical protein